MVVIDHQLCNGPEHLEEYFRQVVSANGEGVMLRSPGSLYEKTRSSHLRKYKAYFDTEVKVIKIKYPGYECLQ